MTDAADLVAQIGRPLRAESTVASRCHLGLPVVAIVPPVLDDGTPFPTRYWLSCPLAVRRVSRLEGAGGVRAIDRRRRADPGFAAAVARAHARYADERDADVPDDAPRRPTGGVAGSDSGVKCLHAHYADRRAGNENPIGDLVEPWVEPLDCDRPCVVDGAPNPAWREPR